MSTYVIIFLAVFFCSLLLQLSFNLLLRRGKQLEKQGRHTEAYRSFENALRWIPPFYHQARATTMMKLSLSAYHAGLLEQSLNWARSALGENPPRLMVMLAHRTAANALSTMNRLDEAELHLRAAWEFANRSGDQNQAAMALIQVATLLRKRGDIDQSLELTRQAMGSLTKQRQLGYLSMFENMSALGRYDEARDSLLQARQELAGPANHHRTRSLGAIALGLVDCEANLGNGDAAWQYLQEAKQLLGHEEKLGLWCEAREAKVLALMGRTQEAMDQMAKVSARADALANTASQSQVWPPAPRTDDDSSDQNTIKVLLENLGRASFELRQYSQGKDYWSRYLALNPAPLGQTTALYFLGECHLGLGDYDGARSAFQNCVNLNIPSHRAKQAWGRLQEIGAATTPA